MIQKTLTVYCDECAYFQPLLSQTIKEAVIELPNQGWELDGKSHYCPSCSLQRAQKRANEGAGE